LKLKYQLIFVKTLTLSKLWNAGVLFVSYYLSLWLKKPLVWGMPASMSIEPTTACNLRCPECPSGLRSFTRPTGNLQQKLLEKTIADTKKYLTTLTFYFQGEPFINPNFLDMVKTASDNNIYTITSTNAHFLTPQNAEKSVTSGLHKMIISIDGTTQETYQQYRKEGTLSKVIEGAKNMVEAKKKLNSLTPLLVFQFLVIKPNEHQIDEVYKLADEIGIDEVTLKTAQIYDFEDGNPLIPENEKYSRYTKLAIGKYKIKNKLLNQCWRMWQGSVITWDGKVVPCCFDKDAQHQMGNISIQSFKDVWHSKPYKNFRKALLTSRSEIDICKNCSEGTEVFA